MDWCASTRWGRRWPTCRRIGRGCGSLPRSTSRLPSPLPAYPRDGEIPMSAKWRSRFLIALTVGAAIGGAVVYFRHGTVTTEPIPGMVRQTEIRIAPETTGRLASLAVGPGQYVHKGDILAVLDNPELAASLGEAKAAAAGARADRDRVYSGVRAEEVAIAAENVRTAEANLLLAQQQNARVIALSARDFASREQLDESNASLAKAQASLDLKKAQY